MFKAYKKYWMGYVDFTGRSSTLRLLVSSSSKYYSNYHFI